jgi:hypothetical protein
VIPDGRWFVFSLAAGFAHAAGATELDIDYFARFHSAQRTHNVIPLPASSRCPRHPVARARVAAHDRYWGD